jgi:TonB family protein
MKPVLRCLLPGMSLMAGLALAEPWDFSEGPPASLPALSRYEAPVFPQRLRPTTVTSGYATMIFTVRPDGNIEDAMALEASDPAFIETTIEALQRWRLAAAHSDTVPRREVIQFDYRRTGTIASLTHSDASKAAWIAAEALTPSIRTMAWEELDDEPERVSGSMPAYPQSLRANPVQGYATIDFVIDVAGAVRVPTVLNASSPEFGDATLTAVRQWRFDPPRQDGTAVNAHVMRSFTFGNALAKRHEERADADAEQIVRNP